MCAVTVRLLWLLLLSLLLLLLVLLVVLLLLLIPARIPCWDAVHRSGTLQLASRRFPFRCAEVATLECSRGSA